MADVQARLVNGRQDARRDRTPGDEHHAEAPSREDKLRERGLHHHCGIVVAEVYPRGDDVGEHGERVGGEPGARADDERDYVGSTDGEEAEQCVGGDRRLLGADGQREGGYPSAHN